MIEVLVYVLLSESMMGLLNCLALSFSFSTHTTFFFIHNHTSISSSSKPSFSPQTPKKEELLCTKRDFNFSCIALLLNACYANVSKALLLGDTETELQRYTDSTEGFTLLRPASWIKLEKAGATVLFEQANKGSNNIGVVVNPVRLSTLGDFGTPQFVADKLIQAEKRKESTIDAELIGVAERSGQKGLQVYEFEYKLDSSRGGMKRIFSAAFVASRKLYLLNINYSDKQESPLDNHTRKMLEEILHSFDAAPMT